MIFDAKGLTIPQVELEMERRFKEYVKIPVVTVKLTKKSPLARVLVIGSGFKEYEGHEKVLDFIGAIMNRHGKMFTIKFVSSEKMLITV